MLNADTNANANADANTDQHILDPREAFVAAFLAQLAYENLNDFATGLSHVFPDDTIDVHFVECSATDTQAFVVNRPHETWVAFRGTERSKLRDWMTDFRWPLTEINQGRNIKVHLGVHRAFLSVVNEIVRKAKNHGNMVATGHSLGGALAGCLYAQTRYLFCPPRIVNATAAQTYCDDTRTHTFIRFLDIVPRVVPRIFGAVHQGTLHFFDRLGALKTNPSDAEAFPMLSIANILQDKQSFHDCIANHSIAWIVDYFEKRLDGQPTSG